MKEEANNASIVTIALLAVVAGLVVVTVVTTQQAAFADKGGQAKVTQCHIPPGNPENRHEVTTGEPSVAAHIRNHGDYIGPCQPNPDPQ
jgi:hypothetical protein